MKLKTSVLAILVFIMLSFLTTHYYSIYKNRSVFLEHSANSIESELSHLKEHLASALNNNHPSDIQKALDKAKADHYLIDSVSFSYDGDTILYSSNRALKDKKADAEYKPISNRLPDELSSEHSKFKYPIDYFDHNGAKKQAYVLLSIDKEYVFGAINNSAWENTRVALIFQFFALSLVMVLAAKFFIKPIYTLVENVKNSNWKSKAFFIKDFSILEAALIDSLWALKLQREELEISLAETKHLDEILRTVADINQLLISSKNTTDLLQQSCDRLAGFGDYKLAWIGFAVDDTVKIAYKSYDSTGYLNDDLRISLNPSDPTSKGPSATSILENKTVIVDFLAYSKEFEPWKERAAKSGFNSSIALPLRSDIYSRPFGTLGVYTDRASGFDKKEVAMLEELAGDIGFAIYSLNQNEAFKQHLITDSLTGLPNRTILFDELEAQKISRVSIVNIDRFKDINEVYGFLFGDEVIKIYGDWLKNFVSKLDGTKLYKLNGAEFAIAFADRHSDESVKTFMEELIKECESRGFLCTDIEVFINITAGYAKTETKTIEYAEMALKKAKAQNKRFMVFDESMLQIEEQKNNILWHKTIKSAVDENRIIPYFQPIVSNETGEIAKYEALIRLAMPNGEIVSPFKFLEISKKMRLYPDLTKIMVNKTIEVFKTSDLPVSINLSFDDIIEKDMQEFLFDKISSTQMGAKIIFEILESEGIRSYEEVKSFINNFRKLGCRFAIDDFGTGYSNFHHILKLEVDTLKIDGSLIKNLPHDKSAQIIVKNINNFAKEMGIQTVAEFVCNKDVFEHVRLIGIDLSQGYHFFEPMPNIIK